MDGDGDQDLLLLAAPGDSSLYRNDAGVFQRMGPETGLDLTGGLVRAELVEFDGDAHLDLLLGGSKNWSVVFKVGQREFRITLLGVGDFSFKKYGAQVTPTDNSTFATTFQVVNVGGSNRLDAKCRSMDLLAHPTELSFVVYRY